MTDSAIDAQKLDIGRVIQETFKVAGRNFATFSVLSLVLVGLPAAVVRYVQFSNLEPGQIPGFGLNMIWPSLVSLTASAILQGTVIYGTVQDLDGKRTSIGESLSVGLRAFLPLIGLSILLAIAWVFGFALLLVPGLMMVCAWCVAVPALVAERRRVFESFGRSAELTRGQRWRIFALLVIFTVIGGVVSMAFNAITGVGNLMSGDFSQAASPLSLVLSALLATAWGLFNATGVAVLYLELRRLKEGSGGRLADIFA